MDHLKMACEIGLKPATMMLDAGERMIIVVLVGDSDDGLVGRFTNRYPEDDDFTGTSVAVVLVK